MNLIEKLFGHHANTIHKSDFLIQFKDCRILKNNRIINDDLWIRNGKILDPEKIFFDEKRQSDLQVFCDGLILVPGFIDVQINGGFGFDFTSDKQDIEESLSFVSKKLLELGVTGFCPTIISSDSEIYKKIVPKIINQQDNEQNSRILGAHLEGPFISKDKCGAHQIKHLKTLDDNIENLHNVYGKSLENVRLITIAPELDPNGVIIKYLNELGIIVSIGHSAASLSDGERAVKQGARFITHLFNAMVPFHHRDPHLIGLLSDRSLHGRLFYGIIADGIHTHPSALDIAYKTNPDALVLVTDAVSAMGLQVGMIHVVGDQEIEIKDEKRAVIANTDTLCGSITTLNRSIKILQNATNCSLVDAIKCASEHPAKMLGIYPKKGSLDYGADADFLLIDENINVYCTFINGDLAWSTSTWRPKLNLRNSEK